MSDRRYQVGDRSMTGAGRIWKSGREVTAKLLGISGEQFKAAVDKGRIVPYVAPADKPEVKKDPPVPVLRAGRILAVIKDLFTADGSRKSQDDFTQDDKPKADVLNIAFARIDDEPEISATERDNIWAAYEAEKAATSDSE